MPASANPDHDIAVVGAGPSGLTAALAFARAGFDTVLIAPGVTKSDGRTTALMTSSTILLDKLGVWKDLAAKAAPLKKMRLIDDTGRLFRAPEVTFDSTELDLDAFGYNILNVDLNTALEAVARTCPGLKLVEGTADQYRFDPDAMTIEIGGTDHVTARLAVAADGRNSSLRAAAGIDVRRWSYPQVAVVLNLDHTVPHHDTSTEFHTPTGPFTLVPLAGNASSLVCVETEAGAQALLALEDDALAMELERRAHSVLGKFSIKTRPQSFPLSGLTAKAFAAQRAALIGETAHVFPPIGAQGLNLSFRDIQTLTDLTTAARRTGADIGGSPVLETYDRKRRPDILSRTGAVDILNRSLLSDMLPLQIARSTGLYLADRLPPLRRLLMREGLAPGMKVPAANR